MADIAKIIEEIKSMTVLELNSLVKAIEEEFGVSAAAVAVAGPAAGAAEAAVGREHRNRSVRRGRTKKTVDRAEGGNYETAEGDPQPSHSQQRLPKKHSKQVRGAFRSGGKAEMDACPVGHCQRKREGKRAYHAGNLYPDHLFRPDRGPGQCTAHENDRRTV